ncbi:hypothetical protein AK812_SmicGene22228 [Symbiodinium microadriaticum]|uniref:Uncharacterized protein n=1 Tax=Symbiodinium microadriaticum TaxID=2951 RepID=A0A1Q9DKC8_SYMMI|nr:hypothetical protein AK812_SmicGene22228 [Symbiodinium microadriaticum]
MQIFCQAIAREFPASSSEFASAGGVERGCLDLARACIFGEREQCLTKGSPHLAPRFCIVLDDMKDDSACRILVQEEVLPEEIEVIDVQDYSNEADDFSCSECVSQMTLCMESGKPVLLRNCSSGKLLCSFYNLLNQNYRVTESAEGQQILYIMIAHGPRVHYCRVHPSFLLVLQMRKEDFLNQPAALRSRFSVVSLPLEQVLHERLGRALARDVQRKAVRTALDTILELVSKLGARSFAGLVEHTVGSLLLSMVSGLQSNKRCLHEFATLCSEGPELNASTAVQVMAVRLLQLLPPEQMVNHASKLGHADFYRNAYFLHQSHFSLVSLLATARTNAESSLPKLVLYTRSSAEIRILQQSCGKNTLWESGGSEHVIVIDAGEVSTTASLEVKLQGSCAEACAAHAVLLVVDMEHSSNERVSCLRTVVDRKARENPSTLFAVLLHYAPEQVIAGSLYPCLFLDGWDFFFIDSLGHCAAFDEECLIKEVMAASAKDVSQRELRIFSEAQSQEKYVVDFCRRVRTVPSRSLRPPAPEPRPENSTSVFSFSSLAATVGRGMGYLFNQIRTGSSDEQKVQRFYVPEATRQERTSAVTLVLHKHPQIWQHLLTTFHDSLPKPTLHGQLIHLAQQVRDGRRLMSFTDALRLQLHGEFRQHATSYLRALCANGGLRTLIADDHGVATSLLPFLPVCSQTGTASEKFVDIPSGLQSCAASPLFQYLHMSLEQMLLHAVRRIPSDQRDDPALVSRLAELARDDLRMLDLCQSAQDGLVREYAIFLLEKSCGGLAVPSEMLSLQLMWLFAPLPAESDIIHQLSCLCASHHAHSRRLGNLSTVLQLCSECPLGQDAGAALAKEAGGANGLGPRFGCSVTGVAQVEAEQSAYDLEEWRKRMEEQATQCLCKLLWTELSRISQQETGESDAVKAWTRLYALAEPHLLAARLKRGPAGGQLQVMSLFVFLLGSDASSSIPLACLCELKDAGAERDFASVLTALSDVSLEESQLASVARSLVVKILYHQGADFKAKLAPGRQEDMLASFWHGWPRGQVLLSDELAVLAISKLGLDQIAEDLVCEERPYLPPYVAQSRDNASRLADLCFAWRCDALCTTNGRSGLLMAFSSRQRLFSHDPRVVDSIELAAWEFVFTKHLARLLSEDDVQVDDLLRQDAALLREASQLFLVAHGPVFLKEVYYQRGWQYLQELLQREDVRTAIPAVPEILRLLSQSDCHAQNSTSRWSRSASWRLALPTFLFLPSNSWSTAEADYGSLSSFLQDALAKPDEDLMFKACVSLRDARGPGHVKTMLILLVYHGYYTLEANASLHMMLEWLPKLAQALDMSDEERHIFACLIDPAGYQPGYNLQNSVAQMFQLDCNDQLQVQIRHCLVNGLACCLSMQGDRRYHFWQHVVDPGSLHGTYGFGSTSNRAIGSIHYDCGCVFEFDGKLRRMEANPHWPAPAAVASYFQSYGAFCLSFAFFPDVAVSLFDRVLTPSSIHSQRETYLNAHGESQSDRTANFCYQRTATSWEFLQAHLQLAGEQVQVLMNRMFERIAAECFQSDCAFKSLYVDAGAQTDAETVFRDILSEELHKLPEKMDHLQQSNLSEVMRSVPRRATFSDLELALAELADFNVEARLLLRFCAARDDLGLMSLVPPIMRFYIWLHADFGDFICRKGRSCEEFGSLSVRQALQEYYSHRERPVGQPHGDRLCSEALQACRSFHKATNGILPVGGCDEPARLPVLDLETPVLDMLSLHGTHDGHDFLFRIMEYLLKRRQAYLDAVEIICQEPEAPPALRQALSLQGTATLQAVVATSLLDLECSMGVDRFDDLAVAACLDPLCEEKTSFDTNLLARHVLQATWTGKSRLDLASIHNGLRLKSHKTDAQQIQDCLESLADRFKQPPPCDQVVQVLDGCLRSCRHADLLGSEQAFERAALLLDDSDNLESDDLLQALESIGIQLPRALVEALQDTTRPGASSSSSSSSTTATSVPGVWKMKHLAVVWKMIRSKLSIRDFAFVQVPDALRRSRIEDTASDEIAHGMELLCPTVQDIDLALSALQSLMGRILDFKDRPIHQVAEDAACDVPLLLALPDSLVGYHYRALCLQLWEARERLSQPGEAGDSGDMPCISALWWEGPMESVQPFSEHDHAPLDRADAASSHYDDEHAGDTGMLEEVEVEQGSIAEYQPAGATSSSRSQAHNNMFTWCEEDDQALDHSEQEQAATIIARNVRSWLLLRQQCRELRALEAAAAAKLQHFWRKLKLNLEEANKLRHCAASVVQHGWRHRAERLHATKLRLSAVSVIQRRWRLRAERLHCQESTTRKLLLKSAFRHWHTFGQRGCPLRMDTSGGVRELRRSPVPAELLVQTVSTAAVQQPDTSGRLAMKWNVRYDGHSASHEREGGLTLSAKPAKLLPHAIRKFNLRPGQEEEEEDAFFLVSNDQEVEARDAPQHTDLRLVQADEVVGVEVLAVNTEEITWTKRMCKDATLLQVAALLQRDGQMNPPFVFADVETMQLLPPSQMLSDRLQQARGLHVQLYSLSSTDCWALSKEPAHYFAIGASPRQRRVAKDEIHGVRTLASKAIG